METLSKSTSRAEGRDLPPFIISDAIAVAETARIISEVRNNSTARSDYLASASKNKTSHYAPLYCLLQAENLSGLINDIKSIANSTELSDLSPVDRENRAKIGNRIRASLFKRMLVDFSAQVEQQCYLPDMLPTGPDLYASSFAAVSNTVYVAETTIQFGVAVSEIVAADEIILAYIAVAAVVVAVADDVPVKTLSRNMLEAMREQTPGETLGAIVGADECRVLSELISRLARSAASVEPSASSEMGNTKQPLSGNCSTRIAPSAI